METFNELSFNTLQEKRETFPRANSKYDSENKKVIRWRACSRNIMKQC